MTRPIAKRHARVAWLPPLAYALLLAAVLLCAPLAEGIRRGLSLCAEAVIPAVFPSMLLSDLLLHASYGRGDGILGRSFSRIFHLPPAAALAYVVGLLTGFPIGIRVTVELYRGGALTREEAERLMAFAGNTGPSFLIAGIGAGLYGDIRIGCMLYVLQVVSSLLIGILLGIGKPTRTDRASLSPTPFRFVDTVRTCAAQTVTLCAFVCVFSAIAHLLTTYIKSEGVLSCILPFLEVSTASSYLGSIYEHSRIALPMTAFAVGFSGTSVHAQSIALLSNTDLKARQYIICKAVQGLICLLLCPVACAVFSIS